MSVIRIIRVSNNTITQEHLNIASIASTSNTPLGMLDVLAIILMSLAAVVGLLSLIYLGVDVYRSFYPATPRHDAEAGDVNLVADENWRVLSSRVEAEYG
jgi:hypothetical protein